MKPARTSVVLAFCVLGISASQLLLAQDPGGLEIANVSGKLEAAVGYELKIKSEDDKEFMAIVDPRQTKIKYTGTADVKFLMPGLLVRFTAAFDQSGKTQAPLTEIEVFTPIQLRRNDQQAAQDQTPNIYPIEKKGKDQAPPAAGFQNYRIVGKLTAIQGDKLQIAAGVRPILVQIDPAITIKVSTGDTSLCMEGDTVQITGLRNPAQENWIKAESIAITGAKPLSPPEKSTRAARPSRTRRGKPDDKSPDKPTAGNKPAGLKQ